MDEKIIKPENASELADIIDNLMAGGSGNVNISAVEGSDGYAVRTIKSKEICGKKGACCQPTELETEDED